MNSDKTTLINLFTKEVSCFNKDELKEVEKNLLAMEKCQNFSLCVLEIIADESIPEPTRFSAAIYFKNYMKKRWPQIEGEADYLPENDRIRIKEGIISLMINVPVKLQRQLNEAILIIADNDFPQKWPNLIQELVANLCDDYRKNNGILETAHLIFKRWRSQFRSNELFSEIKLVLEHFSQPYLDFFKATDALIDSNNNNKEALDILFQALFTITKIFYSLNCQDIPEFFEDHQEEFMTLLHKYLVYSNPLLESDDDEETGIIEKTKTSICEIIDLYAKRYEEVFPKLPEFVQTIWELLTHYGLEPKYDLLVSKAIGFLSSVVKPIRHKELFQNPEILSNICEKIILPNMTLRESDEELFEDDPIEYIRRDLEGSDSETRRRSSSDLIRGLLEHFEKEVTEIFSNYVTMCLQNYNSNPEQNWKAKDTALYLIISLSAKNLASQFGATKVNEYIPLMNVFNENILPDLRAPVNGNIHPIIKVDALKYLITFRNQFLQDKARFKEIFPIIVEHLSSSNYLVHTYAAICITNILSMKQGARLIYGQDDIREYVQVLLISLFGILEKSGQNSAKLSENDYLMKTIARVIVTCHNDIVPFIDDILSKLTNIIGTISVNPSNPKFNHFAFESMGALIRYTCNNNPATVQQFEQFLFPHFQEIIRRDISEFLPYVFQILGEMLKFHSENSVPEAYQNMLPTLLKPSELWENRGNIPAIVRLLKTYLEKGSANIIANNQVPNFLGVFQNLVASKLNDQYGFELLTNIFLYIPMKTLQPYLVNIFLLLLTRLQTLRTAKYTRSFVIFINFLVSVPINDITPSFIFEVFDSVQPKLLHNLLDSIIIPEITEILSPRDRKLCEIGMTNLLTENDNMMVEPYIELLPKLISQIVCLLDIPQAQTEKNVYDIDDYSIEIGEAGYQTTYSRLSSLSETSEKIDYHPNITNTKQFFTQKMLLLQQRKPNEFALALSKIPKDVEMKMQSFTQ
ncbi:Cse1-domain-containing protein [Piromyces finnis]|uniref:Cse1-domain-containing protein n=1 Tax=Piromyces finnis TaxID=1754191 RepID=A0A1Y1UYM5_9FUNG|nr:Cse1-domain-containing protein [Piromyces finnis]|eukprot:ORX43587.1 Cse1-domain-containing protein [Piromyces finnis]